MNIYEYAEEYGESVSDLRREMEEDLHGENMSCDECGATWYSPILNQGSRVDPPEPKYGDCPEGC